MSMTSIDAHLFLRTIRPALQAQDAPELIRRVRQRWTSKEIALLLNRKSPQLRQLAAMVLGLMGDETSIESLLRGLHDDDWQVSELAEQALWAIWLQPPTHQAVGPFREGLALIASEQYDEAIRCFDRTLAIVPEYAEAYNQRAISNFLARRWREAIDDCHSTLEYMPCHFGAIKGLGHCYVQLGELENALDAYRLALKINPRMTCVAQAIDRLQDELAAQLDNSGMYDVGCLLG